MRARTQFGIVIGALMASVMGLSGCVEGASSRQSPFALFKSDRFDTPSAQTSGTGPHALSAANEGEGSPVIDDLLARQSVLTAGSAYHQVASAVLATSSGVAAAELRASKMRAVAREKNWLPTIGPDISLSSLGKLAGGLLVEATLYDNGVRKAQRAFAAADVEVSAVALSQEMNDRVYDGLTLYITISEAREKAEMAERGLGRMREFNRVVTERVRGGASSLSDQRVVGSIISEMEHEARTHREAETSARDELASFTGGADLPILDQATGIAAPSSALVPLDVMRAKAEANRTVAEAQAERAAMLPTLSAATLIGKSTSSSLDYEGDGLGFGTAAEMEASRAREAAAEATVTQAAETAARRAARAESKLSALRRQERDAADLVQQTRANYRIFQDQFEAGQKSVMDVLNVYEQMIREELKHIDLKYEIALTELEIARDEGVLAEGKSI